MFRTHFKDLLERQPGLIVPQVPPYATTILEASKIGASMQEALQHSFQNLGLVSLDENSLSRKAMMQWAAAPLEQLQDAGFFKLFQSEPQIKILAEALDTFEARFQLPDFTETARLLSTLQESMTASLAKFAFAMPSREDSVANFD